MILFLSSSKKKKKKAKRGEERKTKNGVLTEVGVLGDEGQESGSGEGDLGLRGASWWGDRKSLPTGGGAGCLRRRVEERG